MGLLGTPAPNPVPPLPSPEEVKEKAEDAGNATADAANAVVDAISGESSGDDGGGGGGAPSDPPDPLADIRDRAEDTANRIASAGADLLDRVVTEAERAYQDNKQTLETIGIITTTTVLVVVGVVVATFTFGAGGLVLIGTTILRESSKQTKDDLRYYARRLRELNELKTRLTQLLTAAQRELDTAFGKGGDATGPKSGGASTESEDAWIHAKAVLLRVASAIDVLDRHPPNPRAVVDILSEIERGMSVLKTVRVGRGVRPMGPAPAQRFAAPLHLVRYTRVFDKLEKRVKPRPGPRAAKRGFTLTQIQRVRGSVDTVQTKLKLKMLAAR